MASQNKVYMTGLILADAEELQGREHADARRVGVLLEASGKEVRMIVDNDGCGFPPTSGPSIWGFSVFASAGPWFPARCG